MSAHYPENILANVISLIAKLAYLSDRTFEIENIGTETLTFSLTAAANMLEGTVSNLVPGHFAV